ncbi:MAG: hypothetical protein ACRDWT_06450 [Jatrophihabitantaceae bacterium]
MSILGACSDAAQPTSPSSPTSRSSSRPSVTPVTKTAFMARANALCTKSNKKLENAARTAFGSQRPTTQTWRPFMVDVVLPIVEHRLHDLGELPAPTGDQAAVTSITNTGRAAVDTATHNPHILSPLSRAPFDHFDELAIAYGIPGCAVGG